MENTEEGLGIVNDLIKMNNDRVAGFENAAKVLMDKQPGLLDTFNKLEQESRQYATELTEVAGRNGGDVADGTSVSGSMHRAWLDVKSVFTGGDTKSILNECERGEDATKAAYTSALENIGQFGSDTVQILQRQQQGIYAGHNQVKALRDSVTDDDATQNYGTDTNEEQPENFAKTAYNQNAGDETYLDNSVEGELKDDDNGEDSKLMKFFVDELKDLLWAEKKLVDTLPDMAEAATSIELKNAFEMHLAETETHVTRLEQVFGVLGLEPESRKCDAMAGITEEGDEIISATDEGTAQRDVGLIFAGQKAEHYEIASYGGMIALAKTLGYHDIAEILVLTLDEEKTADAKLTEIAETKANYEASLEREND